MSIYEGTVREQDYAHGRDDGRYAADYLAEQGVRNLIPHFDADAREQAQSIYPRPRAYWLGWLRGFREVVR